MHRYPNMLNTALAFLSALCLLYTPARGDSFYLKEEGTNTVHGPFEFSQGARVKIEEKSYVILKKTSEKPLSVQQKLEQTVIPEIQFRNANIQDVLQFLREASIQFSPPMTEAQKGVNIILSPKALNNRATVTFTAKKITLEEALRAVTQTSGLRTRIDGSVIWVVPKE